MIFKYTKYNFVSLIFRLFSPQKIIILISSVLALAVIFFLFVPPNTLIRDVSAGPISTNNSQNIKSAELQKYVAGDIWIDFERIDFAKAYLIEKQRIAEEKAEAERLEAIRIAEEARRKEEERIALEKQRAAQEAALNYYNKAALSNQEAADKIRAKFGANADKALAIASCESGMRSSAVGDVGLAYWQNGVKYGESFGLFQIRYLPGRPSPEWLLNADNNIQKAFEMSGGGTTWKAWSCAKKLGI